MFKKAIVRDKILFKKSTPAAIILLIVLTSVVYANSLKNSFVFDDYSVIVNNDFVKSWRNFPLIFSRAYLPLHSQRNFYAGRNIGSGQLTYCPVVTTFHFIDYSLWRLNPFGFHLTNLILHISNVVLLYFFIGLITKDRKIALLGSLFFGLHPVNSESVNAIAWRTDLLAFLFSISSFILFVKSDYCGRRKKLFYYSASLLLFLLALFSKAVAITLPLLLVLYDYYFVFHGKLKKIFTNFKSRYLGHITASLLFFWIWFFLMGNIRESLVGYPGGNFYINILTMLKVVAIYIKWLLMPISIHPTLPYDSSYLVYSFFTPEALFSLSLIIACLALAIVLYRRSKLISFSILWFFITLLPALNIVPLIYIMASRYLYIPAAGFCLFIAVLLRRLPTLRIFSIPPNILKKLTKYAVVALLLFYSVFTVIRSFTWRNNITFWLELVEYYPDNPLPHENLGGVFRESGLLDKAIEEFKIAVNLAPGFAMSYVNLGVCYGQKKLYKEAMDYLHRAIEIDPMCIEAYNNLGVTYARMEDYAQAREVWEKALEIDPEYKDVQYNPKKLEELGF